MARVSASDVAEIFDTDLSTQSGDALDEWLGIANHIVDDIADKDSSISSDRLADIEKLVTAHMAAAQDPRIESTSRETASVTYQGDTGSMDFRGTLHGQRAIALDPTGHLSTLSKPTASVGVPTIKDLGN